MQQCRGLCCSILHRFGCEITNNNPNDEIIDCFIYVRGEIVVLWSCGFVVLWFCGLVVLWSCGFVVLLIAFLICKNKQQNN